MAKDKKYIKLARKKRSSLNPFILTQRIGKYAYYRVLRYPGTAYSVAAGFACGAAVSFTPFIGIHFVFAALLAWMLRGNILISTIGTIIGNPWTFPFIWYITYNFGIWILGGLVERVKLPTHLSFSFLQENFINIMLPMLVGGTISGIIAGLLSFGVVYYLVLRWRLRRKAKSFIRGTP